MNEILKTIHWRTFFITFVATILLSEYYASIYYAYVFIENSASISALTFFALLSILNLIPKILCYTIAIGAFIAFIKLANNTFISAIILGHIIITPFAVGIGYYHTYLTAKSVNTMWSIKM